MKVTRVRNRVYIGDSRRVKTHAEYAVRDGEQSLARITRLGSKWICCEGREDNRFGLPVSPLNLKTFRAVKQWAIEKWGRGEKGKGEQGGRS